MNQDIGHEMPPLTAKEVMKGPPPESVPLISPNESKAMGLGEQKRSSETLEGREIEAAHQRLDQLGIPQTKELGPGETMGGKKVTHLLRLHGRLRLLQEELVKRGVDNLFSNKPNK